MRFGAGASSALAIANPDGTTLVTSSIGNHLSAFVVEPVTLPQTGTYTLWGDPGGSGTGTLTHWLYTVVDGTATTTLNAAPLSVTTAPTPGARVFINVANATAGQLATVRMTSNSIGLMTVSLLRPPRPTPSRRRRGARRIRRTLARRAWSRPSPPTVPRTSRSTAPSGFGWLRR